MVPSAHKRFGGYCNITHCCKSHHTATAKFSSNATISFSRKSTRKIPLVKTKPFLSTSYGNPSATVVKQHPKISNFLHYASVTAGKCTIVLVQGNVFKAAKTSQTGVPSQNNWDFIRTDKVGRTRSMLKTSASVLLTLSTGSLIVQC